MMGTSFLCEWASRLATLNTHKPVRGKWVGMKAKLLSGNSRLALYHPGTQLDTPAQCDLNTDLVLHKVSALRLLLLAALGHL